ncbi:MULTISPECIES: hypothetical protein [unclassified Novosphingobium]|uniref:hypothetical protein n=1 Tax=unclassified Novosphingobium TaxID=2644732 RepID=UPI001357C23D|nr:MULTISPECIES: hypothetical protein [unclassified Novosphingobium]
MLERICAWGGPFCAAFFGVGLVLAGFVPPPSPMLQQTEIATLYTEHAVAIRSGMVLSLFGLVGYLALVGAISGQMRRMEIRSRTACYLQLGAGTVGMLTVMLPIMILATAAFRPERDPALTQLLNDMGWLVIIPAFPTFIAQFGAIAAGVFADRSAQPIYPRWVAYFNIWIAILFVPGGFAYFVRTGAFAWDGLLAFWAAAGAFFVWLLVMCWQVSSASKRG